MQRLLALAPKRQSQRLQVKQQQQRYETSESESLTKDHQGHTNGGAHGGNSIYMESDEDEYNGNSSANDQSHVPLTEQERARRDEIAKQREYRLQQRLLKRESTHIDQQVQQAVAASAHNGGGIHSGGQPGDETSQTTIDSRLTNGLEATTNNNNNANTNGNAAAASDFNIRNYFLMHKVLTKVLQSKYAWPFKSAVSEEDAPDYYKIIEVRYRHFSRMLLLSVIICI